MAESKETQGAFASLGLENPIVKIADPAFLRLISEDKVRDIVAIQLQAYVGALEHQMKAAQAMLEVIQKR